MNSMLSNNEKILLGKILEGDIDSLKRFSDQLVNLQVKERRKKYHTYEVWFSTECVKSNFCRTVEDDCQISDTVFYVNESDILLHARLRILDGQLNKLLIGGNYDFSEEFTITKVCWEVQDDRNLDKTKRKLVNKASSRDAKVAISYFPVYR